MSIHKRTYKRKNGRVSTYYQAVVKARGLPSVSKQFERKIDAENWERQQRVKLKGEKPLHAESQTVTVKALCKRWLEEFAKTSLEWSSYQRYEGISRRYITPTFGTTKLSDLSAAMAETWVRGLVNRHRLAAKTANLCLGLLRKMLTDGVRWGLTSYNPIASVKPLR